MVQWVTLTSPSSRVPVQSSSRVPVQSQKHAGSWISSPILPLGVNVYAWSPVRFHFMLRFLRIGFESKDTLTSINQWLKTNEWKMKMKKQEKWHLTSFEVWSHVQETSGASLSMHFQRWTLLYLHHHCAFTPEEVAEHSRDGVTDVFSSYSKGVLFLTFNSVTKTVCVTKSGIRGLRVL